MHYFLLDIIFYVVKSLTLINLSLISLYLSFLLIHQSSVSYSYYPQMLLYALMFSYLYQMNTFDAFVQVMCSVLSVLIQD